MLADFRWFLAAATIATAVGALSIPTFQRLFSSAVGHFQANRSMPRLIARAFSRRGLSSFATNVRIPSPQNLKQLGSGTGVSMPVIGLNVIAMALWTLGVFASLYAGYLKPELRVTCSNLSSVVNGVATILMFVFIDPQVSVMTDDVIEGRISDGRFRRAITSLLGARLAGTVLAQILVPVRCSDYANCGSDLVIQLRGLPGGKAEFWPKVALGESTLADPFGDQFCPLTPCIGHNPGSDSQLPVCRRSGNCRLTLRRQLW